MMDWFARAGWDVERDGLAGGPRVTVVAGTERHSTVDRAMRLAGLGSRPVLVDVDEHGAMRPDALAAALPYVDHYTFAGAGHIPHRTHADEFATS